MILELVEHGLLIWLTIKENGVTRTKKCVELYDAEKIQADYDMKETNIILQGKMKVCDKKHEKRSIAGGLDHVNPVIRLPLEHGISRVLKKDAYSNSSVCTNPVTASITKYQGSKRCAMVALRREAWPPCYETNQGVGSRCGVI
nr:hypothetical protein [Tanacetum cinerariifolium]